MFGFPISFGTPLILAALRVLPMLWWLLRVTPPLPRRTLFPPLRLLRGLEDEEQAPAATPWSIKALTASLLSAVSAISIWLSRRASPIGRTVNWV